VASHLDEIVVKHGMPWDQVVAYVAKRGPALPRVVYLDGSLEMMWPSRRHEVSRKSISMILEEYLVAACIDFNGLGASLLTNQQANVGIEPDESYVIGAVHRPQPDLVIDVLGTTGRATKLEIYRRLGIGEVWFWSKTKLRAFVLLDDHYEERSRSGYLPSFDFDVVGQLIELPHHSDVKKAARRRFAPSSSS
jgi:Uma2 family endonuclease